MFVHLDLVCKDKPWVDHILGSLQRYIAQSRLVSDPGVYLYIRGEGILKFHHIIMAIVNSYVKNNFKNNVFYGAF